MFHTCMITNMHNPRQTNVDSELPTANKRLKPLKLAFNAKEVKCKTCEMKNPNAKPLAGEAWDSSRLKRENANL